MAPSNQGQYGRLTAAPAAVEVDPRVVARDVLHRTLGNPTGQAQGMVAELNDEEVADVVLAGQDKQTARGRVKQILAKAYDRRRDAHAVEARQEGKSQRRRTLARIVLERELKLTSPESADVVAQLDEGSVNILVGLEHERDTAHVCAAVLERAGCRPPGYPAADEEPTTLAVEGAHAASDEPPATPLPANSETEGPADEPTAASEETEGPADETTDVSPETEAEPVAPASETEDEPVAAEPPAPQPAKPAKPPRKAKPAADA